MADLVVGASDLAKYLGVTFTTDQEARADFLIGQIILLCEAVVKPLPAEAMPVVLDAAADAYVTPPGALTAEMIGPYQASRRPGGLYLSKAQRSSLKLLAGGGGAFSIDLIPGYPDARFT